MGKKDDEIERKLKELESSVIKEKISSETENQLSAPKKTTQLQVVQGSDVKSDLCYFAGLGLIFVGLMMLFQHVRVGTGLFAMLGMGSQGFGILLIPLMVGIGWIIYDSRNKWAWALTSLTCAVICFSILTSLVLSFPSLSLLSLILMLLPFAAGGALLLKGVGGPKGLEEKLKLEDKLKNDK